MIDIIQKSEGIGARGALSREVKRATSGWMGSGILG
jgi:hypothetical protein